MFDQMNDEIITLTSGKLSDVKRILPPRGMNTVEEKHLGYLPSSVSGSLEVDRCNSPLSKEDRLNGLQIQ